MLTKSDIEKLSHPDITHKEYKDLHNRIDQRFYEIIKTVAPSLQTGKSWFDYDNCDYHKEGPTGYYDPVAHRTTIGIGGENKGLPAPFESGIPTRWLWEPDFEAEFQREVLAARTKAAHIKAREKTKREAAKTERKRIQDVIRTKLSKEELKHIQFKP